MRYALLTLGLLFGFCLPVAFAQTNNLENLIDEVGREANLSTDVPTVTINCPPDAGGCDLAGAFVYVTRQARPLIVALAILIIVISGFRLIISQTDEALSSARRAVTGAVTGLFLVFLAEQFVDVIYGGFGFEANTILNNPGTAQDAAVSMGEEIIGLLRWIETLVAAAAVGFLVVQAVAALGSFGSENQIRRVYTAAGSTAFALLLLTFKGVIVRIFGFREEPVLPGAPNASLFVQEAFGLAMFLLTFVGIAVIGVIIYAGLLMILHFGNEELINKGKTTILNAVIGLVLIVMSILIIQTVLNTAG